VILGMSGGMGEAVMLHSHCGFVSEGPFSHCREGGLFVGSFEKAKLGGN
jgi:hypothetical protein